MAHLHPIRTFPSRCAGFAAHKLSSLGERHEIDWLTYNPLQLHLYHQMALRDAPGVIGGIEEVFPGPLRVADVGAGSGAFAAEAKRRGHLVEACEYTRSGRLYARLQGVRSRSFDLGEDLPARLSGDFDLVYCFEVAEHCAPPLGDRLVRFLATVAPVVVFTAAQPGQGGLGHINEQGPDYWIARFAEVGQSHRDDLSQSLRDAFARCGVEAPWFRDNLMVFARTTASREVGQGRRVGKDDANLSRDGDVERRAVHR